MYKILLVEDEKIIKESFSIEMMSNDKLHDHIQANINNPLVEKMLKHIHENISNNDLSLCWIAKELLFMNEEYLGRAFRKSMKERFSDYILRLRMEIAKKLIENREDLRINEVSRVIGFKEGNQYFSKVFKQYVGVTPSEYRKQAKKMVLSVKVV
jgi:two-component system response regulator YesN